MISWPDTKFLPEFTELAAIVGRAKIASPEKWPEFARLVELFGFPLVIRAASKCPPENRWANAVEHECRLIKAAKEQEESEGRQRSQPVFTAEERKARTERMKQIVAEVRAYQP